MLRMLTAFPVACFTGALLTDAAYGCTANMMWADFSAWLLAVGMAGGVLAAIAGLVSWMFRRRAMRFNWTVALGSLLILVVAFINNLVHTRDAWTSVMPLGLTLSAITVLILLVTGWLVSGSRRQDPALFSFGERP